MRTREIPRYRWTAFLDRFSREYSGCLCTLEIDTEVTIGETETEDWPLGGVAVEDGDGDARVQVFVGERPECHLGHSIEHARHVFLEETDDGARAGLRIDADDGAIHLRFTTPQEEAYVETYLP